MSGFVSQPGRWVSSHLLRTTRVALMCLFAVGGISCGSDGPTTPQPLQPYVSLSYASGGLVVGTTRTITAQVLSGPNVGIDTVITGQSVAWTVSDTAILGVTPGASSAVVTGKRLGSATVIATVGNAQAVGYFTVIPVPVAYILVSPSSATPLVGDSVQFTATAADSALHPLTDRVFTWTSIDTLVASVTASGLVTAKRAGNTQIVVQTGGKTVGTYITVRARVASVAVSPDSSYLTVGTSTTLLAKPKDSAGNELTGRTVTWSSSDTTVATVSTDGVVSGVALGSVTISATSEGKSAAVHVTMFQVAPQTLSAGIMFSCAVSTAGTLYCWGRNYSGQLGDGTFTDRSTPVVAGNLAFVAVSAGSAHACGLTTARRAYCWGANDYGQVGDGTTSPTSSPVPVFGDYTRFVSVAAFKSASSCGLTTTGLATCWGANARGELGDGSYGTQLVTSNYVGSGMSFAAISAGAQYSCGLTASGTAYCWGAGGTSNALGNNGGTGGTTPGPVNGGHQFVALAAGSNHACGLTATGSAYCWGQNYWGEIGDGTTAWATTPTAVSGPSFVMISAGDFHTCGLTAAGAAYCWGQNTYGQLGDGTTTAATTPVAVAGGLQFTRISTGDYHSCGLTAAGAAYCWGQNGYGQLGNGTTSNSSKPVAVSGGIIFKP